MITVYSVAYREGRSMRIKRKWFITATDADIWIETMPGRLVEGPLTHVMQAKRVSLVSILNMYCT